MSAAQSANVQPKQTRTIPDRAHILRALKALIPQGQVTELRALGVPGWNGRTDTYSGYFDDLEALAGEAERLSMRGAEGVYVIPNVVKPDLLARAANRVKVAKTGETTSESGIVARRYLLIDIDPVRDSRISSTDKEHELAIETAQDVAQALRAGGWPEPILGDSGNGGHVLYRIDLPAKDDGLVKRCLEALAFRFDDELVHIDTSTANASRLWKLYGTVARKGDHIPQRPHRMARLLSVPGEQGVVSREQLEALAASIPQQPKQQPKRAASTYDGPEFDLEAWIAQHNLDVGERRDWEKGHKWVFRVCPWNSEHTDRSAYIVQFSDGAIAAGCHHNGCSGKKWADLRELYDGPATERIKQPRSAQPQMQDAQQDAHDSANTEETTDDLSTVALLKYDPDDNGNAQSMYRLYGRQFLFTPAYGWLRWTGTHWGQVPEAIVALYAIRTLKTRRLAAVEAGAEAIVKVTAASRDRVSGCYTLFKSYVIEPSVDVFDAHPDLLNCQNGVVDLRTGILTPHDFTQRFTYCVPVDYDPSANMTAWADFVHDALGHDEQKSQYFQVCAGYSLTGHTSDEKMFYLYGPPRAGKGTVSETLLALLPQPLGSEVDFNSFTARRDNDNQNFDLAELKPARVVFASESNRYQSLNPAKIKQVTGGNYVRCAFKHKDMFSYRPQFKVWLVSNHKVKADADDDALWGRVQVFDFPHSHLGEEDTTLKKRMKSVENLRGVLRWAVEGAMRWYEAGQLTPPDAVTKATREHRAEQDYIRQWIEDCCDLTPDAWTPSSALLTSYRGWCEANTTKPLSPNDLAETLVKRFGCTPKRLPKVGTRGYKGIVVRSATPPDPDPGVTPSEAASFQEDSPNSSEGVTPGDTDIRENPLCRGKSRNAESDATRRHPVTPVSPLSDESECDHPPKKLRGLPDGSIYCEGCEATVSPAQRKAGV